MAQTKSRSAPVKEQPAKRQPDYVIRAKVKEETKDGSRMRWTTIGAMWSADLALSLIHI